MLRLQLLILAINFTTVIFSFADANEFDHVALLECDQKNGRFKLFVLGKGNAETITKNIEKVQGLYLFTNYTVKKPNRYRFCLVSLTSDENNLTRKITWINPEEPIEPQLLNLGLDKKLVEKLLLGNHKGTDKLSEDNNPLDVERK